MLLDTQSPIGLLNQVIEIIGILPSRVCGRARSNKLMDPQLTNYFPSETEGAESEDQDISMDSQFSNNFPPETEGVEYEYRDVDYTIHFWGTEIPKWFNHQNDDNSIFFFVGRKFPKLVVCIFGRISGHIDISINGYTQCKYKYIDQIGNNLCLFSPTQQSLQRHLNKSNPTDQNLVEVSITDEFNDICYCLKRNRGHLMNSEEICLNKKITLKLFLLCRFGLVSFAFDAKLTRMVAVEVIGRP
nr:hypothetical protein CFP56_29136 [Quercus suber]